MLADSVKRYHLTVRVVAEVDCSGVIVARQHSSSLAEAPTARHVLSGISDTDRVRLRKMRPHTGKSGASSSATHRMTREVRNIPVRGYWQCARQPSSLA